METLEGLMLLSIIAMPFVYYKRAKKHHFKQGVFKASLKFLSVIIILPIVFALYTDPTAYGMYFITSVIGAWVYVLKYKES